MLYAAEVFEVGWTVVASETMPQTSDSAGKHAPAFVSLPSACDIDRRTTVLTEDLAGSGAWMSTSDRSGSS